MILDDVMDVTVGREWQGSWASGWLNDVTSRERQPPGLAAAAAALARAMHATIKTSTPAGREHTGYSAPAGAAANTHVAASGRSPSNAPATGPEDRPSATDQAGAPSRGLPRSKEAATASTSLLARATSLPRDHSPARKRSAIVPEGVINKYSAHQRRLPSKDVYSEEPESPPLQGSLRGYKEFFQGLERGVDMQKKMLEKIPHPKPSILLSSRIHDRVKRDVKHVVTALNNYLDTPVSFY
jgi:hypothetical protein